MFEGSLLGGCQLIWPGPDFLQTQKIRFVLFPPMISAFLDSCPDSIDIPGSNCEHFLIVTEMLDLRGRSDLGGLQSKNFSRNNINILC